MRKKVSLSKLALMTAAIAAILIIALLANLAFTQNISIYRARTPLRVVPVTAYEVTQVENANSPTGVSNRYTWKLGPSAAGILVSRHGLDAKLRRDRTECTVFIA